MTSEPTLVASPLASPRKHVVPPSPLEGNDAVDLPASPTSPGAPRDPRLERRSSTDIPRRKPVPTSLAAQHERQQSYPLDDIDEQRAQLERDGGGTNVADSGHGALQGTPQHYQQQLPKFNGRVTSMQSFDSRQLQTPSPDLDRILPDNDPPIQAPLVSPTFTPKHTIPDRPAAQPQMAVISSGESNRSSKTSSNFDDLLRQTDTPLSNLSLQPDEAPKPQKLYPQLQYHHEQFVEGPDGLPKFVGEQHHPAPTLDPKANGGYSRNSSSPSSDSQQNGRFLAPNGVNRKMSRPSSTYSMSLNSGEGRRASASPQQRAVSASYDPRKSSYLDLTLPVHMQAPPPLASTDNTNLRELVGTNAALLSNKQTLELYRQNAKKSQDPMLQYELAVFMVQAAQQSEDPPPHSKKEPGSPYSNDDYHASRKELLREARGLLERLSNKLPQAQYYLGDAYASGLFNKGVSENEKAFPLFVAASKHGHAEAGYRAGLCYEFGWGCRKDPAKAVQFYRQAASKTHPGAMTRLGMACLRKDLGLIGKQKEGIKWLKRATDVADEQYPSAPYELGRLHETGLEPDIFLDLNYAANLYTQAANLGHADACFKMGEAYEHGKLNCPKDPGLSIHYYWGAAQQGHALAKMALCAWYLLGAEPVLEKNEDEAYVFALQAAESGLPKAEYAVGYFTEMGIGCRRDPLEANVWYVKAADHGDERAIQRLKIINEAASGGHNPASKNGAAKKAKENDKGRVLTRKRSDAGPVETAADAPDKGDCVIM